MTLLSTIRLTCNPGPTFDKGLTVTKKAGDVLLINNKSSRYLFEPLPGIIINTAPIHGTIFVILRHLCWSKISFAALVPEDRKYALRLERKWSRSWTIKMGVVRCQLNIWPKRHGVESTFLADSLTIGHSEKCKARALSILHWWSKMSIKWYDSYSPS